MNSKNKDNVLTPKCTYSLFPKKHMGFLPELRKQGAF